MSSYTLRFIGGPLDGEVQTVKGLPSPVIATAEPGDTTIIPSTYKGLDGSTEKVMYVGHRHRDRPNEFVYFERSKPLSQGEKFNLFRQHIMGTIRARLEEESEQGQ